MTPTSRLVTAALAPASSMPAPAMGAAELPISSVVIDVTAARAMKVFNVPGMAVAIVKDGQLLFSKGYGVRALGQPELVDEDTVFQIGSTTKAFTAVALAILVDEGKLHWDDKVIDHLPQFLLSDPYATREFTVRDLLSHRSGLGRGAGDLMFYPSTDFTRADIVRGLRHLKPVTGFRSEYAYENTLYVVAGEVIPAVTGQSWEDFVEQRILKSLNMHSGAANHDRLTDRGNVASPHMLVEGKLTRTAVESLTAIGPAGAINCSARDMVTWLQTQLAGGRTPDGVQLFSPECGEEMWTMQTVQPVELYEAALLRTHFKGCGLGWEITDEFGFKRVSHTGRVPGSTTWISLIPEQNLGVIVFANQFDSFAAEAVGNQILDAYVGAPQRDMVQLLQDMREQSAAEAQTIETKATETAATAAASPLPLESYAGRYIDPWRGEATVRQEGNALVLKVSRTSHLEGLLVPYRGHTFIVRWNDRSLNADAFVRFSEGFDTPIEGMTMRAVSPATDFSFDFQDLDFKKAP